MESSLSATLENALPSKTLSPQLHPLSWGVAEPFPSPKMLGEPLRWDWDQAWGQGSHCLPVPILAPISALALLSPAPGSVPTVPDSIARVSTTAWSSAAAIPDAVPAASHAEQWDEPIPWCHVRLLSL